MIRNKTYFAFMIMLIAGNNMEAKKELTSLQKKLIAGGTALGTAALTAGTIGAGVYFSKKSGQKSTYESKLGGSPDLSKLSQRSLSRTSVSDPYFGKSSTSLSEYGSAPLFEDEPSAEEIKIP